MTNSLGAPALSRVLELDRFTGRVGWQCGGSAGEAFHSEGMGSVQRLPPYWGLMLSPGSWSTEALPIGRCGNAASFFYLLSPDGI